MSDHVSVPAWVLRTWHVSALATTLLLVVLAWSSFRTSALTEDVVTEVRATNSFWVGLVARQDSINSARQDSVRAAQRDTGRTP